MSVISPITSVLKQSPISCLISLFTDHSDNDLVAAMDQDRFGTGSVNSPLCGKQVEITNTDNGKTVIVTIEDDCPTCDNSNSIDLSIAAFNTIADPEAGIVPIKWKYLS
ncbi:barwin-like endoglucanase [Pluteus cervinus]|uniref:Barwin-like endoglucanase n=1 Tax=Pluteus cervinus TaxID=181527 RepID=A0ACD3BER7_9AGAR|nr:barwin-like endoglucanase [Pluteus cervinus]